MKTFTLVCVALLGLSFCCDTAAQGPRVEFFSSKKPTVITSQVRVRMRAYLASQAAQIVLDNKSPSPAPDVPPSPTPANGVCTACKGTKLTPDGLDSCPRCHGTGKEPAKAEAPPDPARSSGVTSIDDPPVAMASDSAILDAIADLRKQIDELKLAKTIADPIQAAPMLGERPLIVVFSKPGPPGTCPPCDHFDEDRGLLQDDFQFLVIKEKTLFPNWVINVAKNDDVQNPGGYPIFFWTLGDGEERYSCGWFGPAQFKAKFLKSLEEGKKALQGDPEKMNKPKSPTFSRKAIATAENHTELFYDQTRWPTAWMWSGSLRQHVKHNPHDLKQHQVDAMTDVEVVNWHTAHHKSMVQKLQSKVQARVDNKMQRMVNQDTPRQGLFGVMARGLFGAPRRRSNRCANGMCQ